VAALIAAQRDQHRIPHAASCRALSVSRSWFYKHKDGGLTPQAARRAALAAEVRRLFAAHRGTYGSPRITADLRDAGWKVSENTVAALMAEQGLAARRKRKRRATTRPGKGRWRAADLVKRDFPAQKINTKWYGDGTEIKTGQGKLYLASVLDMASRRVLGFALGEHHDAQLAYGALAMAVAVRGGQVPGVIFRSDRGSEYTARAFRAACQRLSVCQSMGRPGSALLLRGHRILALDPGVRAPLGRAFRHQGRGPGQGLGLDPRVQPHPPAFGLPDDVPSRLRAGAGGWEAA
jgi:putative transposase